MKDNPDISGFASGIGSELNRLTHPEMANSGFNSGVSRPSPPTRGVGGLQFDEQPTANHAGSEVVAVEVPNPSMIPIPDDMKEMVAEQMRSENPPSAQPAKSQPEHTGVSIDEPTAHHTATTPVLEVPDGFDFDLFQFAMMKDSLERLNAMISDINANLVVLEDHRKTLLRAIQSSKLDRTT